MEHIKYIGIVFLLFFITTISYSHYYNNYQHLIGDKATGMGGAHTALANTGTSL